MKCFRIKSLLLFIWISFYSQFTIEAEHRIFTLEIEEQQAYLRSYIHPLGYASGEISRRKLNARIPGVDAGSQLEIAEFGQSWKGWQVVTASFLEQKISIQSFAAPDFQEQTDLHLLSSVEVTSIYGEVLDLDILSFDSLDLGYDQIHLFCSTPSGHYSVTLVAPTEPDGQWRQSNWRPVHQFWPERGFQLIRFQANKSRWYDSAKAELVTFQKNREENRLRFPFASPDDLYLEDGEKQQMSLIDRRGRSFLNLHPSTHKLQSQVTLEFKGEIIDVVTTELLDLPATPSLKPQIYFSQRTRLDEQGKTWVSWPEEDSRFRLRFELSYYGESSLERGALNYQIWWKVPSPSWDIQSGSVIPDQLGKIRRPLDPGDKVEFEQAMIWPYEMIDGRWVNQSSKVQTPYWSLILVYSDTGELRAREAIPWLARPLRCYSNLSVTEKFSQLHFFDSLHLMWRHQGGKEAKVLYFEGFFEYQNEQSSFSVTKDNFWKKLQPWRAQVSNEFDPLWIASWNQSGDDLVWPNWQHKTDLFESWKIQVQLSDGIPLDEGLWSLESETGERLLERKIKNGLVNVLQDGQEEDLKRLWSSQSLVEKVKDDQRKRVYKVRENQGMSGAEKMGWLWVQQGTRIMEELELPWGDHPEKWQPIKELFFHQGNWLFSLSDPDSPDLNLILETSRGRSEKRYPFEFGHLKMPLALEDGETIHSIWLKRLGGVESLWSEAIHLFPMDKILSIKSQIDSASGDQGSTWLVESGDSTFLLVWNNLNCMRSINLKPLHKYGIQRVSQDLPGSWLIQLQEPCHGHRLLTWAPQYSNQMVLGGDRSTLKSVGDFTGIGDLEQRFVVVGDLEDHSLKMYSSDWQSVDRWHKPGFSPHAILRDLLDPNMFWVLDRRKTGQSFLYLFLWQNSKIQFQSVTLNPIPLTQSRGHLYGGMGMTINEKQQRIFAFSDPDQKTILEYWLDEDAFTLKVKSKYTKSSLQQGNKPLLFPGDLIYMGPANARRLYVQDAQNSFFRVN